MGGPKRLKKEQPIEKVVGKRDPMSFSFDLLPKTQIPAPYCPFEFSLFEFITFPFAKFQEAAVVNYPCNYEFTRIGEYKYFWTSKFPHG